MKDGRFDARQGTDTSALRFDQGMIAIDASPPFGLMANIPFLLQRLQCGEDRSIREVFLQSRSHIRHCRRPQAPKDAHDLKLSWWKVDVVHIILITDVYVIWCWSTMLST